MIKSLSFGERKELNQFINENNISKADIIDIQYHWNLGMYQYVLSFYADERLNNAIRKQESINKKENRKFQYSLLIFGLIIFIIILFTVAFILIGI